MKSYLLSVLLIPVIAVVLPVIAVVFVAGYTAAALLGKVEVEKV